MIHRLKIIALICALFPLYPADAADEYFGSYPYLTISDQLLSESQALVAPFDDGGLDGALSYYGLPAYNNLVDYQNFPMDDPLYGALPFSWLNPRMQKIAVDSASSRICLSPFYADSGMNMSRFDYYRGDYGYLNFAALLSGNISENIKWRLYGEKLTYSGGYGLLGSTYMKTGGNPVQNYFLDIRKTKDDWQLDIGSSYQKFIHGLADFSVLGISGGEIYLNWLHAGRLKEQRTNFYLSGTRTNSAGILKTGLQMSNFLYNTTHDSTQYSYSAEAYQYAGIFQKIFQLANGSIITLSETPLIESVYVRNGKQKERLELRQAVSYLKSNRRLSYLLKLGSVNLQPTAKLSVNYRLSNHFRFDAQTILDYISYPLSYFTNIAGNSGALADKNGFSAFQQTVAVDFRFNNSNIRSQLNYNNASYLVPYKSSITTTNYAFQTKKLSRWFLTEEFNLTFPWQIQLRARIIFATPPKNESTSFLQSWARMYKDVWLFDHNLNLYLTGDIYYLSDSKSFIWFEQLRTRATTDVEYYTNERLSAGATLGAHIGTFHIFYTIANIEGRALSILPGTPLRNRLKIFGVDWTFIN